MFGITLGIRCFPQSGAHHLGSLSSLDNIILIISGCLLGVVFVQSPLSSRLSLCVVCWGWGGATRCLESP